MNPRNYVFVLWTLISFLLFCCSPKETSENDLSHLMEIFKSPPHEAHPGVYWYFMDGNLDKEAMTKDLESMKAVGISHVVFLEVNVGIPRGKVDFMSDEWLDCFAYLEKECRRLEIGITLGVGPGWTGSGGPWVEGYESMQHLVGSEHRAKGGGKVKIKLEKPKGNPPFFGEGAFTKELLARWNEYYEDVMVLAFPYGEYLETKIDSIDRKSLVYTYPYTSDPRAVAFLPEPSSKKNTGIPKNSIIDISEFMNEDGVLEWDAPEGDWTIVRFGSRNNGAVTRPAPLPGVGFESDKFDTMALNRHLDNFLGKILAKIGPINQSEKGGLKMLHMDSWEMGAQNWTKKFREEFSRLKGYDPAPYFPVYLGMIVGDQEESERFLWDLRMVSQELILKNHAGHIKKYANKLGLGLSIEPYDMNPTSDLMLGSVADVPMGEFWVDTFNAAFAVIQASSIAHTNGKNIVPSEAFTSGESFIEGVQARMNHHPGTIKNKGDWAFAGGINRLVYHTFAHKPLGDHLRPGMTMGPYGIHWDRGQIWWDMSKDYHDYVARSSALLQVGKPITDILFLTPEGVPHAFVPPPTALSGTTCAPNKKGYSFDAIHPHLLMERAAVKEGKIVFENGPSYSVIVLPIQETMTPEVLEFVYQMADQGATIIGSPVRRSPSLSSLPKADQQVQQLAKKIWGDGNNLNQLTELKVGKGKVYTGGKLLVKDGKSLYPAYDEIANVLKKEGLHEDLSSTSSEIRYIHRKYNNSDIYFVSNTSEKEMSTLLTFRVSGKSASLWDPVTGEIRHLPNVEHKDQLTSIALSFYPNESFFVVFSDQKISNSLQENTPQLSTVLDLKGPWNVEFDTKWGGPSETIFDQLVDWSKHTDERINYYSGKAIYRFEFDFDPELKTSYVIDFGKISSLGTVILNGKSLGSVWTYPYRVNVTDNFIQGRNVLEVIVANQWTNRLIGDESKPFDGVVTGPYVDGIQQSLWPDWLINGEERTSGRLTFVTHQLVKAQDNLIESGLLGPVKLMVVQ